jgi:Domain of unknown function (DUF6048)
MMSENHPNRCSYIYILLLSMLSLFCVSPVFAQVDTTVAEDTVVKVKKKDLAGHQLTIGVDIFRPIMSNWVTDRYAYEIATSYYMCNEYYITLDGGWGGSSVNYSNLQYTTTNQFLRLGFNKSILVRDRPNDWDMMFIGFGAGATTIARGNANYVITDSIWGDRAGVQAGNTFGAYWAELTGGVRVAIVKNLFLGWNIRAKFMMNGNSFKDLSPLYIAGYGRGDKNSAFDFNAYVAYGIRWKRKNGPRVDEQTGKILPTPVPTTNSPITPVVPGKTAIDSVSVKPGMRNKRDQ